MNIFDTSLCPLHFAPIYQKRIWGGTLMAETFGRSVPVSNEPIGEAWEITDRDEATSCVDRGVFTGVTLRELIEKRHSELLGPKCAAMTRFPLLIKLIDAGEKLSLQVHPDEKACAMIGGGAEPKTEMWYVLNARKDAKIFAGIQMRCTRVRMTEMLQSPEIADLLQNFPSQCGDAYFITAGMLHAIGGGNLILEIQQNSDTTYRVSDWGRLDSNGNPRALHVEQALQSIDFTNRVNPRVPAESGTARSNRKAALVQNCRSFAVDCLHLVEPWHDSTRQTGSFHLLCATDKPIRVEKAADSECFGEAAPGETLLIPYGIGEYRILPLQGAARVVKATL